MIEQIISVTIFVIMFAVIISEKIERHLVSLGCGLLMLIIVYGVCMKDPVAIWDTLNLKSFITLSFWYTKGSAEGTSGINWSTIVFIFGMMIMVEGMGRAGFFRWLCLRIASIVNFKLMPVFISFMVMAFTLAMFIDSITVILFLAAVTVELAELLRFSPVPMILAEIFCSNLGGAATMCGDPPNIIIGTSLGYSFYDFIQNTGVIAFIGLLVTIVYFVLHFGKQFKEHGTPAIQDNLPNPGEAIKSKCDFIVSSLIFLCAIILLVSHAITGLTVATIGLLIALLTIIFSGREAFSIIRKIDYKTLLFFVGLFIVVDGLEKTKVLMLISSTISSLCGGNAHLMIAVILWVSAIASAFIDNIPFAATMIPVISSLATTSGVDLSVLSWTLACGTDIGGCATPIGASANVVGVSIATSNGHIIGWSGYCRTMLPITCIIIIMSMIIIFVKYL